MLIIQSTPHSGSTLFERMLASSGELAPLGELSGFASYFSNDKEICGCGSIASECTFWRNVLEQKGIQDASMFEFAKRPKLKIFSALCFFITGATPLLANILAKAGVHSFKTARDTVRQQVSIALEAARQQQMNVIIDKSMSASRVTDLVAYSSDELRIISLHLVREPAGVAASWKKRGKDVFFSSRLWKRTNVAIWLSRKITGLPKVQVSYEALCESPDLAIQKLGEELGLQLKLDISKFPVHGHSLGGNSNRFNSLDSVRNNENDQQILTESERKTVQKKTSWLLSRLLPAKRS